MGFFGLLPDELRLLGKHLTSAAFFISNLTYLNESGYFDVDAFSKPLLHLWSLGVEEQYYIVWPLLIIVLFKSSLMPIFYCLVLASLAYSIYAVTSNETVAYYSPISRFWELGLGSFLASITNSENKNKWREPSGSKLTELAFSVGLTMILLSILGLAAKGSFPGINAIPVTLGSFIVIYYGNNSVLAKTVFANKVSVYIGKISYPLYLWHWPILSFGYLYYSEFPKREYRLAAVLLSFVLAILTFHLIERPLKKFTSYLLPTSLIFIMSLIGLAGAYFYNTDGLPNRTSLKQITFSEKAREQFTGALWGYTSNTQCLNDFPYPAIGELKWWFCMKSSERAPTVIILGNSYANQLYPGFVKNKELAHHTFLSIGTCSVIGNKYDDISHPCYGRRRAEQKKFINKILVDHKTIKFVIIDGLDPNTNEENINQLLIKIKWLSSLGKSVVVFKPHLKPNFHPKRCFSTLLRNSSNECKFNISDRIDLNSKVDSLFAAIKQQKIAFIFDQNDVFCPDSKCSWVRNSMPLHRDTGHTSEYASIILQQYFTPWMRDNLPELLNDENP